MIEVEKIYIKEEVFDSTPKAEKRMNELKKEGYTAWIEQKHIFSESSNNSAIAYYSFLPQVMRIEYVVKGYMKVC